MKRLAMVAAALLVLAGSSPAQGQDQEASEAATVEEVRQAIGGYREALVRGDSAELGRIWADDYEFVNPRGESVTKAQRLANLGSGATQITAVEGDEEIEVRALGDVALAMGHVRLTGKYGGEESTGDYRSLQVWAKRDGRWQLVVGQLTPVVQ